MQAAPSKAEFRIRILDNYGEVIVAKKKKHNGEIWKCCSSRRAFKEASFGTNREICRIWSWLQNYKWPGIIRYVVFSLFHLHPSCSFPLSLFERWLNLVWFMLFVNYIMTKCNVINSVCLYSHACVSKNKCRYSCSNRGEKACYLRNWCSWWPGPGPDKTCLGKVFFGFLFNFHLPVMFPFLVRDHVIRWHCPRFGAWHSENMWLWIMISFS